MSGPDPRLVALMTQQVKLYAPSTTDLYGNHTWAAPVTVNCHIRHDVLPSSGSGAIIIYLASIVVGLDSTWRLEFPRQSDGTMVEAIIMYVKGAYDETGLVYQQILAGEHTEKANIHFRGGGQF